MAASHHSPSNKRALEKGDRKKEDFPHLERGLTCEPARPLKPPTVRNIIMGVDAHYRLNA